MALANSPEALPLALRAVEMAVANGDPCLVNFSESLLAHAHLCLWDKFWAGRVLEGSFVAPVPGLLGERIGPE